MVDYRPAGRPSIPDINGNNASRQDARRTDSIAARCTTRRVRAAACRESQPARLVGWLDCRLPVMPPTLPQFCQGGHRVVTQPEVSTPTGGTTSSVLASAISDGEAGDVPGRPGFLFREQHTAATRRAFALLIVRPPTRPGWAPPSACPRSANGRGAVECCMRLRPAFAEQRRMREPPDRKHQRLGGFDTRSLAAILSRHRISPIRGRSGAATADTERSAEHPDSAGLSDPADIG